MNGRHASTLTGVLALASALPFGCKPICTSSLVRANADIGDLALLAPVAKIEDDVLPPAPREGCAAGGQAVALHAGKLGPFGVRYEPYDYKGAPVTTGGPLFLFDPACPSGSTFRFTMRSREEVNLRHDEKRDLWIVTNGSDAAGALVLRR